jgi:hypothetical protein
MATVKVPTRGDRSARRGTPRRWQNTGLLACLLVWFAWLACQPLPGQAATVYSGEYRGEYSFHFRERGLQPGVSFSDEADELFSWDVHFRRAAGAAPITAAIIATGSDRFVRAGDVEAPEEVSCSVAPSPSPMLAPQYFDVQPGTSSATVDLHAIVPILTGASGQVVVAPISNGLCHALDATGAAVNCDPFGCGWECASFAADPAFDGAWSISLSGVPLRSLPRSFEASETSAPCSEATVAYTATRSIKATLSVLVQAPPAPKAHHKASRNSHTRRKRSALHSAGR